VKLSLYYASLARVEAPTAKGALVKASGQHSDIFSLGAVIYFIASGGRNPEEFWSRCVALAHDAESARWPTSSHVMAGHEFRLRRDGVRSTELVQNDVQSDKVFDTCLSFATALCHRARWASRDLAMLDTKAAVWGSTWCNCRDVHNPAVINAPTAQPRGGTFIDRHGRLKRCRCRSCILVLRCMRPRSPDSFVKRRDGGSRSTDQRLVDTGRRKGMRAVLSIAS
jgi:hypothetical protein